MCVYLFHLKWLRLILGEAGDFFLFFFCDFVRSAGLFFFFYIYIKNRALGVPNGVLLNLKWFPLEYFKNWGKKKKKAAEFTILTAGFAIYIFYFLLGLQKNTLFFCWVCSFPYILPLNLIIFGWTQEIYCIC